MVQPSYSDRPRADQMVALMCKAMKARTASLRRPRGTELEPGNLYQIHLAQSIFKSLSHCAVKKFRPRRTAK
eukprot:763164-Hanusia_phi.AAC.1